MDFWMFLFFDAMFFILGVVIDRWFLPPAASRSDVPVEREQPTSEPGTFGASTYLQTVALIVQVDALIKEMDDAEGDKLIDEMQL